MPSLQHAAMANLATRQEPSGEMPPMMDVNAGVDSRRSTIIGASAFMIILAVGSTVARIVFRKAQKLPLKWDDHFIVLGMLIAVANAACYLACLQYGFGHHIFVVPPEDLLTFFKLAFATFHLYGGAITMVKISLLLFYHRIFPRSFNKSLLALALLSIVWWVAFIFITTFQCLPVQKIWNAETPGVCINYLYIYIGLQVWNILLDIAILCLPISAVMRLQMSKANKISVAGTFALGGLSIVFAIVRLAILISSRDQTDITYDIETAIWSLIEPAFQIFCVSLPTFTPILKAGRYFSNWSSRYGSGSSSFFKKKQSTGSSEAVIHSKENYGHFSTISEQSQKPY